MMCGGSLLIAVIPAGLGVASTARLVVARVVQGLSMGGEYGASAIYLSEMASPRSRGFWSGVYFSTLIGGQLVALLLLIAMQAPLSFEKAGNEAGYFWLIASVMAAGFCVATAMRDTQKHSRITEHS